LLDFYFVILAFPQFSNIKLQISGLRRLFNLLQEHWTKSYLVVTMCLNFGVSYLYFTWMCREHLYCGQEKVLLKWYILFSISSKPH